MFTHRFFAAIGRANHQAAVEAARYAVAEDSGVLYASEVPPAEEPIQESSNPTPDVVSAGPAPNFGTAPPVQSPLPTPGVVALEEAAEPTSDTTLEPIAEPSTVPTVEPIPEPTPQPTAEPTPEPTALPTAEPTPEPTALPTAEPTPEPTLQPTPEGQEGLDYAFAQGLLRLTNDARIANGLAPLNEHPALMAAAQKYAEIHTQLSPLQLSHEADGSTFTARIEREGYTNWACLGENLHLNPLDIPRTVEQTFQNWMTGAHRDNILSPDFQDIGIACYVGMAEPYPVQICVQNFGARS
jgi:uncharacterized protein YkwD